MKGSFKECSLTLSHLRTARRRSSRGSLRSGAVASCWRTVRRVGAPWACGGEPQSHYRPRRPAAAVGRPVPRWWPAAHPSRALERESAATCERKRRVIRRNVQKRKKFHSQSVSKASNSTFTITTAIFPWEGATQT